MEIIKVLWPIYVFQIINQWKYEFLELHDVSHFPPKLALVLCMWLWFFNLQIILQKMLSTKLLNKLDRRNSIVQKAHCAIANFRIIFA